LAQSSATNDHSESDDDDREHGPQRAISELVDEYYCQTEADDDSGLSTG